MTGLAVFLLVLMAGAVVAIGWAAWVDTRRPDRTDCPVQWPPVE